MSLLLDAETSSTLEEIAPTLGDAAPTAGELTEAREWLAEVLDANPGSVIFGYDYATSMARTVLRSVLRGDVTPDAIAYRARMTLALFAVAGETPAGGAR
jgi:hypothetical protein